MFYHDNSEIFVPDNLRVELRYPEYSRQVTDPEKIKALRSSLEFS